jgi:uncharacterized protein
VNIVDAHAHLPPGLEATDRLLRVMDRSEIARAVLVPGGTVTPDLLSKQMSDGGGLDVTPDNARVEKACAASGGRLVPFYFANPHRGPGPYAREGAAFRGLKLGPAVHGVPFDDERVVGLVREAGRHRHPVYLHCLSRPGFRVDDVVTLARKFPSVPILIGHAAGGHCEFHALDLVASLSNVSIEMSGGFTSFVAASIARLGADRVLFGSEYPLQDPRAELAKMRCLELSAADFGRILGRNIERHLGVVS